MHSTIFRLYYRNSDCKTCRVTFTSLLTWCASEKWCTPSHLKKCRFRRHRRHRRHRHRRPTSNVLWELPSWTSVKCWRRTAAAVTSGSSRSACFRRTRKTSVSCTTRWSGNRTASTARCPATPTTVSSYRCGYSTATCDRCARRTRWRSKMYRPRRKWVFQTW